MNDNAKSEATQADATTRKWAHTDTQIHKIHKRGAMWTKRIVDRIGMTIEDDKSKKGLKVKHEHKHEHDQHEHVLQQKRRCERGGGQGWPSVVW